MLTVENLEKRFVSHFLNGKEIVGFPSVSFRVECGKALGLSGPNGTGKSSVLKCIYRAYRTSSGTITYDSAACGRLDLTTLPENEILKLRRTEMGYATQFMAGDLTVLVLAAGRGTRMRSAVAKVLHPVLGRPLLAWPLDVARALPAARRAVIVGFQADVVARALPHGFETVLQVKLWGTGHAVRQARRLFACAGDTDVLSGDTPLLAAATVRRLLAVHRRRRAAVSFLTARPADPAGYGRVVRCGEGRVKAIVEHDDAPPGVREIREVNAGVYCFENRFLERALGRLCAANRQEEYYLTDVIAAAVREGRAVFGLPCDVPEEMLGVNVRAQLAHVAAVLRRRILGRLMRAGVTVVDPESTWVEPTVRVGADTVLFNSGRRSRVRRSWRRVVAYPVNMHRQLANPTPL